MQFEYEMAASLADQEMTSVQNHTCCMLNEREQTSSIIPAPGDEVDEDSAGRPLNNRTTQLANQHQ